MNSISTTPQDILSYWFGELHSDTEIPEDRSALWWKKDPSTDYFIRQCFEPALTHATLGKLDDWKKTARDSLAWIVLQDQFSRNMYRDTPAAFEADLACQIQSLEGIESGLDQELRPLERVFYYMPLEHAEDLEVQEKSLEMFAALLQAAPPETKKTFENFYTFAEKHHAIIARFGRFPHRNAILGRENSPQETEFLKQPGSSF